MADAVETTYPDVATQKGALIGDENAPAPREPEVDVVDKAVKAQVVAQSAPAPSKVNVHETSVRLDEPVLDPSAPEAVIVPDAGRGSLELPIHQLAKGTVEEQFAALAKADEDKA